MQTDQLLPGPRISRISIGRLHNLGNYEHVRYEVTVELPPGTSPGSVMRELEDSLAQLEPKCPVSSFEVMRAHERLKKPVEPDDGWDAKDREAAAATLQRVEAWRKQRDAALARFDQLGGTRVFTDAKEDWEDDQ